MTRRPAVTRTDIKRVLEGARAAGAVRAKVKIREAEFEIDLTKPGDLFPQSKEPVAPAREIAL